ncbi:hypothetical protein RRF57_012515 [Xylaria bambusicola]|uniref:Uncharacterized protein n=1 Tax=Xylaria bambusicola TaxID=326684 RepID=A0AAN7ZEW8_9PEZI
MASELGDLEHLNDLKMLLVPNRFRLFPNMLVVLSVFAESKHIRMVIWKCSHRPELTGVLSVSLIQAVGLPLQAVEGCDLVSSQYPLIRVEFVSLSG